MKKKNLLFGLLVFASCARTVYVPVQHTVTRTDTLLSRVMQRDSIHVTDSVSVHVKGDTVFIREKSTAWRERTVTDTLREKVVERDTVPVVVEVEKPLSSWQKAKQDYGGWSLAALVMIGLIAGFRRK